LLRLEDAYQLWKSGQIQELKESARQFAMGYDWDKVAEKYRLPGLEVIEEKIKHRKPYPVSGNPTLSGLVITTNSKDRIEKALKSLRSFCDEVVTVVNKDTDSETLEICQRLSDKCIQWDIDGYLENILEKATNELCSCDWVLRLDDDELISINFLDKKFTLLHAPVDYWYFPRHALVGDERHYISSEPWYPDHQARLFRRGKLKCSPIRHYPPYSNSNIAGYANNVHIFHYPFVLYDRETRQRQWEANNNQSECYREIEWFRHWKIYEDYEFTVATTAETPIIDNFTPAEELYNNSYFGGFKELRPIYHEIARVIYEELEPKSVVDFGCGVGYILEELEERGVQIFGMDVSLGAMGNMMPRSVADCVFEADVSERLNINKHDIAISTEVAEHLTEDKALILIDNLTRASDTVVFSTADEGAYARGHINLRPRDYWIKEFEKRGFKLSERTASINEKLWPILAGTKMAHMKNLMVFQLG